MGKIFILVIFILGFNSCKHPIEAYFYDYRFSNEWKNIKLYDLDIPSFKNHKEISRYIKKNIYYKDISHLRVADTKTTLSRGFGCCKEIAIIFADFSYQAFGEEAHIVIVKRKSWIKAIIGGGDPEHVLVMINGIIYNTYTGEPINDCPVEYIYYFKDVFLRK